MYLGVMVSSADVLLVKAYLGVMVLPWFITVLTCVSILECYGLFR